MTARYYLNSLELAVLYLNSTKCCQTEEGCKECQCRAGLFPYRTQDYPPRSQVREKALETRLQVGNSNKLVYLTSRMTVLSSMQYKAPLR